MRERHEWDDETVPDATHAPPGTYLTFDGSRYTYQPMTTGEPASSFWREVWRCWWRVFVVLAGLYTLYYLLPFPPLLVWGLAVHP
jgi:hypothetical protein